MELYLSSKKIYIGTFVIFYIIFSFFMITEFPKIWIDESWTAIAPYALLHEGKLTESMLTGTGYASGEHLLAPRIAQSILLAGEYRVFGFGIIQSRALSVFAGLCLLLIVYIFARRYYDRTTALLAVIILAFDNVFFVCSRTVRPEIFVALFGASSFFLFIHGVENKSLPAFACSGILMGVSGYTHPNSFLILVAILGIFAYEYRLSLFRSKGFWIFLAFCIIGFSPYAIYVIKEDYGNGFSNFFNQIGGRAADLKENYFAKYLMEYARYDNYIYFPRRLIIILVQIFALIYAAFSKNRRDRYLMVWILIFVGLLPLWNSGNPTSRYFMAFIPAISILVSRLFIDILRKFKHLELKDVRLTRRIAPIVTFVVLLLFLFNEVGGDLYMLWQHRTNGFEPFIKEVRGSIPRDSKVWGSTAFWIGLYDYPYITQSSPYKVVEEFKPEYVILYDSSIWSQKSATTGRHADTDVIYSKIANKMESLCATKGLVIKRINNEFYGNIAICKLNWDK